VPCRVWKSLTERPRGKYPPAFVIRSFWWLCGIAETRKLTRLPREAGSTSPFRYSIESGSLRRRKEQLELCQEHEVVGSRIFRRKSDAVYPCSPKDHLSSKLRDVRRMEPDPPEEVVSTKRRDRTILGIQIA
jgi:hypothetical protein